MSSIAPSSLNAIGQAVTQMAGKNNRIVQAVAKHTEGLVNQHLGASGAIAGTGGLMALIGQGLSYLSAHGPLATALSSGHSLAAIGTSAPALTAAASNPALWITAAVAGVVALVSPVLNALLGKRLDHIDQSLDTQKEPDNVYKFTLDEAVKGLQALTNPPSEESSSPATTSKPGSTKASTFSTEA